MAPQTDDLFPDKPADGATPDTTPALDAAALQSALAAALEQHVAPLNRNLAELSKQVNSLRTPAPAPKTTPTGGDPIPDTLAAFMDNPESVIEGIAKKAIAKTVLPAVKLNLEQTAQDVVVGHRDAIDKEFGTGTWKDLFEKDVTEELEGLPLEMQASKRHVLQAVSAVYGRLHMDPLIRAKLEEKRTDTTKSAATPVMLSGPGRGRPNNDDMSTDETNFLSALQRSGFDVDRSHYMTARKLGGGEAAWKAHFAKQRKEASK
jgi:hypothetical protein